MKIAILGAGKVGTAIARTSIRAQHEVRIAGSGAADDIRLLIDIVAPGAIAATVPEAVIDSDIVILALPAPKFPSLDPHLLAGRIVIDAMNYWPDTDGLVDAFTETTRTSSEVVGAHLPAARLVKTLNHIGYHDLETDGRAPGAVDRRALAIVSNDVSAAKVVAGFIDSLGYDPVIATPLRVGRLLEPGSVIFTSALGAEELCRRVDGRAGGESAA